MKIYDEVMRNCACFVSRAIHTEFIPFIFVQFVAIHSE